MPVIAIRSWPGDTHHIAAMRSTNELQPFEQSLTLFTRRSGVEISFRLLILTAERVAN
jgi:hypothetical protein